MLFLLFRFVFVSMKITGLEFGALFIYLGSRTGAHIHASSLFHAGLRRSYFEHTNVL